MFNTTHFHPLIVHFPVALILVGFLADLLFLVFNKEVCLSKAGLWLMVLGTLGAAAGYLTGQFFTSHPSDGAIVEIFERHESLALTTLVIMGIGCLLRLVLLFYKIDKPILRWTVFVLYMAGAISVGITGHLGGTMVMDYMMGL